MGPSETWSSMGDLNREERSFRGRVLIVLGKRERVACMLLNITPASGRNGTNPRLLIGPEC